MHITGREFVALLSHVVLLCAATFTQASDYYVYVEGSDDAEGSRAAPFRSLQKAIQTMQPGDTCVVGAGRYTSPLKMTGKLATADQPFTFRAAPGKTVILDGTIPISATWSRGRKGVYEATLPQNVYQLFHDDQLVQLARWPNATFEDGSIWNMVACMRGRGEGSDLGRMVDAHPQETDFDEHGREAVQRELARLRANGQRLGQAGFDATGAIAVLNIGHWLTWARPVIEHRRGANVFQYETDGLDFLKKRTFPHGNYYLLGLPCLDRENEWWFDRATKTAYLIPPGGQDPNTLKLRAKVRDYAVVVDTCQHVRFSGFRFFGAAPLVRNSSHVVFANCEFSYPSTHKWILGNYDWFGSNPKSVDENGKQSPFLIAGGEHNALLNCVVRHCNSPVFLVSKHMRVENCLFHDIEWDLNSGGGSGSVCPGEGALFRRNSFHTAGNSEGIRPTGRGCTLEFNRIWNVSLLQHDGAAINMGISAQSGCVVRHNWAYDTNRQGIRFDAVTKGTSGKPWYGTAGFYHHNVMFDCGTCQIKGDEHVVMNNTSFRARSRHDVTDMTIFLSENAGGINRRTITRNNLARLARRWWPGGKADRGNLYQLPGVADHNLTEKDAALAYLRDPTHFDFRPRKGSPLIDRGAAVRLSEIASAEVRFEPPRFSGTAPDVGAYEFGDERYWIPGRQTPAASSPIPPDGATMVKRDTALMWLDARQAKSHDVYFGTSRSLIAKANPESAAFQGNSTTNVHLPSWRNELRRRGTFFWRVDAVRNDGTKVEGKVWSFRVK